MTGKNLTDKSLTGKGLTNKRLTRKNLADKRLTDKNLIADFGFTSEIGINLISALVRALESKLDNRTKTEPLLRDRFSLFDSNAKSGSRSESGSGSGHSRILDINPNTTVSEFFFVLQTYIALVMKLLAAGIISRHRPGSNPDILAHLSNLDDDHLPDWINRQIEQSMFFTNAGLDGFVEHTPFSWYTEISPTMENRSPTTESRIEIARGIRDMALCLNRYDLEDLKQAHSSDIPGKFHHHMIPASLRKPLGEFYTPDWLVSITCDRAETGDWLALRVLDPTCGSGAFLMEIIRRKRTAALSSGMSDEQTLEHILATVQGMEISPLAVQSARVNVLISIIDLPAMKKRRSGQKIRIPVVQADAILSPTDLFGTGAAGKFDLVIGNPPWVKWSNLPESYRTRIKPACLNQGILPDTAYHGGSELDFSCVLTHAVADKWLKTGGDLVFIVTRSIFQSPSASGFRNFKISNDTNLVPVSVDDLGKAKPFPDVAMSPAILRMTKTTGNTGPKYPVPWRIRGKFDTAETTLSRIPVQHHEANPVDGANGPWAILPPGRFRQLAALRGTTRWLTGRKGVTTDLNGVYMLRVINQDPKTGLVQVETRPEAGRKEIGPARRFWIEPDLLYPLLKGAGDFSACHLHSRENLFVLIPNNGIVKSALEDARAVLSVLPNTLDFLYTYKDLLETRSTLNRNRGTTPFYAIHNIGPYSFAPWKVIWAEMSSTLESVVISGSDVPFIGRRNFIPDHKVYFVGLDDRDTAFFVCGLLNSFPVREYIDSHTLKIQVGNIFKHLALPEFLRTDPDHKALATLCALAHTECNMERKTELVSEFSEIAEWILVSGNHSLETG